MPHKALPPRTSTTFGLTSSISVLSSTSCWSISIPCSLARIWNVFFCSPILGGTSYLQIFVIQQSFLFIPASFSNLSSSRPLGPTNGLPTAVSSLDGASPSIISLALGFPQPGTYLWSVIFLYCGWLVLLHNKYATHVHFLQSRNTNHFHVPFLHPHDRTHNSYISIGILS